MSASFRPKDKLYDGTIRDIYSVAFFMKYNPDFGEDQLFHAVVDAQTLKVMFILIGHGYQEVIYDKDERPIKTKFISPSKPYDTQ